jgi:hypothetical protein
VTSIEVIDGVMRPQDETEDVYHENCGSPLGCLLYAGATFRPSPWARGPRAGASGSIDSVEVPLPEAADGRASHMTTNKATLIAMHSARKLLVILSHH